MGLSEQELAVIEAKLQCVADGQIALNVDHDARALLVEVRRLREEDVHWAVQVGAFHDEVERLQEVVEAKVETCPVCKFWIAEGDRLRAFIESIVTHDHQGCPDGGCDQVFTQARAILGRTATQHPRARKQVGARSRLLRGEADFDHEHQVEGA